MNELNCCTFSGDNSNKLQYYKHCKTCNGDDADKHVCLNCLAICHDGHEMGPLTLGSVHCDCGASGSCKALRHQETAAPTKPQTTGKRGRAAKEAPSIFTVNDKSCASLFQSNSALLSTSTVDNDDDAMVIFTTQPYMPVNDDHEKKVCTIIQTNYLLYALVYT